jgi:antirestriction protein ArdC
LGGQVRKGEKGSVIVFWTMFDTEEKDDNGKVIKRPFLRYSTVFHLSQIDGIESKMKPIEESKNHTIAEIEDCFKKFETDTGLNVEFIDGNDSAFYSPSQDKVVLPTLKQFNSENHFYSTYAHELAHSTGHDKRLKRELSGYYANHDNYSKEELIAEITSAMITNHFNIDTKDVFESNASYIASWVKHLQDDKNMIISASGKAQKAFDMIIGIDEIDETEQEQEQEQEQ